MARAQLKVEAGERAGETELAGQPGVQALTRGIQILDHLALAARGLRFTDLLERTGMPKGTLHRLLQALADERLISLDARDQTYRLASRLFQWAHKVWDEFDLRGAAEPELVRLRDMTGETIRLGVLEGTSVLYVDQREVAQPLRLNNGVGSRVEAYASGLGKAIMAHLSLERRRALLSAATLDPLTPNTIVDADELDRQLDLTKARAYAISVDEQNVGISSVAAAILNHRGEPIGAIGVIGPSFRLPVERLHTLGRDVIEAARRITGNIGEVSDVDRRAAPPARPRPGGRKLRHSGQRFSRRGPVLVGERQPAVFRRYPGPGPVHWRSLDGDVQFAAARRVDRLCRAAPDGRAGGRHAWRDPGARSATGVTTALVHPEADRPGNRFNDGKCDRPAGSGPVRLPSTLLPDRGRLWRIDGDASAHEMDRGFHVANGLGWSPDDKVFYFTDTQHRRSTPTISTCRPAKSRTGAPSWSPRPRGSRTA